MIIFFSYFYWNNQVTEETVTTFKYIYLSIFCLWGKICGQQLVIRWYQRKKVVEFDNVRFLQEPCNRVNLFLRYTYLQNSSFPVLFGGGGGLLVHHINTNLLTKAQRTLSCIWFLTNFYKKSRPFLPKSVQAFKNEYSKIVGVLLYNVFIIFV